MKKLNDVIRDKIWVLSSQKEFDGDERITTIINIRLVDPLWVQITTQITDQLLFNIDLK
jgi:hypothetical protein